MIRRFASLSLSASIAALTALAPTASALADGYAGDRVYRPARAATRAPAPAPIVTYAPPPVADQVLRVDLTAGPDARTLNLPRGKSAIIELPVDVRDMLVTNPKVADAVLRNPRRIYVLGVGKGSTDAVFFDAAGRRLLSLAIRVEEDSDMLQDTLRKVLPDSRIEVQPVRDSVILTGTVANASDSSKAALVAAQFVAKPEQVVNMLTIAGKDQVMLKVRIVEVQRNIIKQLGVSTSNLLNDGFKTYSLGRENTFAVNGGMLGGASACYGRNNVRTTNYTNGASINNQGVVTTGDSNAGSTTIQRVETNGNVTTTTTTTNGADSGSVTNTLTGVLSSAASTAYSMATGNNLNACLQAFERVGLIRTLAEPNLTVVSGEAGKFLAGGEFPVPTGSDEDGRVTIEFKPYGVGLGYTPVVMSGGRISLKLSTEVSELSSLGAFTVGSGTSSTLVIPGLSVRRAETTVELPSGGALMIAGLLHQQTKENIDSLPGMTSLPILGSLFRSRDYLNGETELVVIITPYIVDPSRPQDMQTPADGLQIAGDMSTVLLGRLNKVVKAPAGANTERTYQGPVGYVIE
ncbi:type II and III secretion system protein family protein [Caulobacter endophyticus]|uniref:type II and III secretion system protein family protein n=1 Tax=Caulobacter endophyticus TaxID=2172652 RepID=UPI00240FB0E9|nr:type II and III secretion system protein family protein [Caulobacter endophyticus]MDG2530981.1 type II and III secretion system protein family protein [Caulobacter endophyticus]